LPNKLIIIQQGESLPFKFDRGGASIEGFTCQIKVKQKPTDIPDIDRAITADDDRAFSDFLTHTETLNLIAGLWYLTGVLTNEGTDEQEEIPVRFQVTKSWAIPNKVAFVTFSPLPADILQPTQINLSTLTANAIIRFTLDGAEPTSNSPIFEGVPIDLPIGVQTIKAFAAKTGFENSDITTAVYPVVFGQVAPVTFSPVPNGEDTDTLFTLATTTGGATIHFTKNGDTPTTGSEVFNLPFTLPFGVQTVKAFAVLVDFSNSIQTEAIYTVGVPFPIISGLFARYDLSNVPSVSLSGSDITQINDLSGGHNLLDPGSGNRPVYNQPAGLPFFADFDGANDFMATALFTEGAQAQPNTIIVIYRLKNAGATQVIYDGPVGNQHGVQTITGPLFRIKGGSFPEFSPTIPDTIKHNIAVVFNGASSKGFVDGGVNELSATVGTNSFTKLTVGAGDGGTFGNSSLEFFAWVMYDRALSDSELNELGNFYALTQAINYTNI